jgi:hypothetical protein
MRVARDGLWFALRGAWSLGVDVGRLVVVIVLFVVLALALGLVLERLIVIVVMVLVLVLVLGLVLKGLVCVGGVRGRSLGRGVAMLVSDVQLIPAGREDTLLN